MKILYVNGADREGGAAKAATRLLQGIREQGPEAELLVQRKHGDDASVKGPATRGGKLMAFARPSLEEAIFGIPPRKLEGPFAAAFLPDGLLPAIDGFAPDILHLHWVARMMRLETLARLDMPIVWTMHDSWAFTGGCYLPLDCTRYRESCGRCPVLRSGSDRDLSRRIWRRKEKRWRGVNLTVVAPSRWMAACARASSLFAGVPVEVIPNGIDVRRYQPLDRGTARDILSLPRDKKLVLFGAKGGGSDRNKGFALLAEALGALSASGRRDDLELVIFGSSAPAAGAEFGFQTHYLGWQQDDVTLALLYCAADLFVLPSISENLPYTVMEALACGTPCVAFDQGGVPDLIEHGVNGYLAEAHAPRDLARGIAWVVEDEERRRQLGGNARESVVQRFALEAVAKRHLTLYRELLERRQGGPRPGSSR